MDSLRYDFLNLNEHHCRSTFNSFRKGLHAKRKEELTRQLLFKVALSNDKLMHPIIYVLFTGDECQEPKVCIFHSPGGKKSNSEI